MRRRFLITSVRDLMPADVALVDVVFMWRRSALMPLWAAAAAVLVYIAASVFDYGNASTRVGLGVAVAVIIAVVVTDNRVLATTSAGTHLFVASRVRQIAVSSLGPMPPDSTIELVGANLVLTEWVVDGERYSVPKSSQAAMTRIADAA